jgi:DNA-binding transcriptional LysR family regulator
MNLEQIEAFLYVSLTSSFSKAGEILYTSQPSISARIKSLESEVGFQLFYRSGKNIALTIEGEIFLPYAKTVAENVQAGLSAIHQKNSLPTGELSISIVLTFSNYILPILLKDFHETFPKIKLTVHTGHSHNVLDMVLNHEVPLGISRSVSHPRIETIHLFEDELVFTIYPNHPFSSRKTVSLEEAGNEPLILYNRGSIDWTLINNAFNNLRIKPNVVLETDNIELVKQMVKKEMGMGILPRSTIEGELIMNSLHVVDLSYLPKPSRPFQLIYLKETKIEGILKLFIDFTSEKINKIYKLPR